MILLMSRLVNASTTFNKGAFSHDNGERSGRLKILKALFPSFVANLSQESIIELDWEVLL